MDVFKIHRRTSPHLIKVLLLFLDFILVILAHIMELVDEDTRKVLLPLDIFVPFVPAPRPLLRSHGF